MAVQRFGVSAMVWKWQTFNTVITQPDMGEEEGDIKTDFVVHCDMVPRKRDFITVLRTVVKYWSEDNETHSSGMQLRFAASICRSECMQMEAGYRP